MSKENEIRKALLRLFQGEAPVQVFAGKVKAVSQTDFTCDVDPADGGATFFNVRLKASVDNDTNGIVAIPEVGSDVLCGVIANNHNAIFVLMYTKIETYKITSASGGFLELDKNGQIKLNGDSLGGLVKVNVLKTELAKTNAVVNAIKNVLMQWVVAPGDGGAALKAFAIANLTPQATGDFSQIENVKVKQG